VGIGQLAQTLLEILLSGEGTVILGIAAVVAILSPVVQRYVANRKRVLYRVQHDSKIGLSFDLHDVNDADEHAHEELIDIARLVDQLTIVVIRIRNSGGDVSLADLDGPVEFTFGAREIWNARISDPSEPTHREALVASLEFTPAGGPQTTNGGQPKPTVPTTLPNVRGTLPQRILKAIRSSPTEPAPVPDPEPEPPPPAPTGILLKATLSLQAKEKFKLVVVLHEPPGNPSGELTKGVTGPAGKKRIKDERTVRRATWPLVTAALGVLVAGVLVAANVFINARTVAGPAVECASGELAVVGSSAFAPSMSSIAKEYTRSCGDAAITVTPTGSINGVREVAGVEPAQRHTKAALSDGKVGEATAELVPQPIAVIVYTMVVNNSVGLDRLTDNQIRAIYAGRYRNWNELRPGPSLPIRIVGRGGESGSRKTFEQTMLGGLPEGALTSDSCETANRSPTSPTILCERGTEAEVLDEVSSTPGALGYVDLPSANEAKVAKRPLTVLRLGTQYPDVSSISAGYPFWTIEYLYTNGEPAAGTLLASFIDYLHSGTARAELADDGYTPCIGKDGQPYLLCHD
jgi:ABC-type phosphate transport system substrate-binding protein